MRVEVNHVAYNVETAISPDGVIDHTILLLHGFTGSVATWTLFMADLARQGRAIAVDLLGHGDSAAPDDSFRYSMERCVTDLLAILDSLEIPTVTVLGYSMGGRVALHLAARAPERVQALILESASPGIDAASEREARIAADEELATLIEQEGLAAFVDRWEQTPLFQSQMSLPAETRAALRCQRLHNSPHGLACSLRGMGTGRQESLWAHLPALSMPVLLITGALDDKFCRLAHQMATSLPQASIAIIPDAGHAVHLEQPAAFATAIEAWRTVPTLSSFITHH